MRNKYFCSLVVCLLWMVNVAYSQVGYNLKDPMLIKHIPNSERIDKKSYLHSQQVDSVMKGMSIRDKVAQLLVIEISRFPSEKTAARQDSLVSIYGIGNIILMRGPIHHFIERVNHFQTISKIPIMVATDGEWGASMRFSEYPSYPRQAQLARIEKRAEKLLYQMGLNVGRELRELNILVNYAPVADVSSAENPSDSQRSFSADPKQVANLSTAYMRGMQDAGIYACGKHYPGHGGTTVDSHYEMPIIDKSIEDLANVDLYPYKKMFLHGLEMVMVGHFSIPSIDSSGVPMSISEKCINGLLRDKMGFNGVVITDAIPMKGLSKDLTPLEANIAVYKAGADMLLMPLDAMRTIDAITDSVRLGVFPIEELNRKVRKVLMLKARAGYFEKDFNPLVVDLDKKIAQAAKRDKRLIKKMRRLILKSKKPQIEPVGEDRTLLLDKAGE